QPIGGEGIIVEADESKFGKRRYNRGHRIEGIWILNGWRGYSRLNEDYEHSIVKHNEDFKDPESSEHTNTIE
ncbi:hypothetical protein FHG87_016671, partial [Trinorchestia longiramus]